MVPGTWNAGHYMNATKRRFAFYLVTIQVCSNGLLPEQGSPDLFGCNMRYNNTQQN